MTEATLSADDLSKMKTIAHLTVLEASITAAIALHPRSTEVCNIIKMMPGAMTASILMREGDPPEMTERFAVLCDHVKEISDRFIQTAVDARKAVNKK